MQGVFTYHLQLLGQIAANEINSMSPVQIILEASGADSTQLTIYTDQAGLIGLLRYLHGLGLVVMKVERER